MSGKWFQGKPGMVKPDTAVEIESIDRQKLFGPEHYDAEEGLADAVNVALLLDQPLLLTGEPGTGKTQLGEKLAAELGLQLFKLETKSTSVAQDLFYTFDHVARFQAAQISKDEAFLSALRFIEYGALGRAVVQSLDTEAAGKLFPQGQLPDWYKGPARAVVLIDEIDKAPSEFPNDALNEIERHYVVSRTDSRFTAPFVADWFTAERGLVVDYSDRFDRGRRDADRRQRGVGFAVWGWELFQSALRGVRGRVAPATSG